MLFFILDPSLFTILFSFEFFNLFFSNYVTIFKTTAKFKCLSLTR